MDVENESMSNNSCNRLVSVLIPVYNAGIYLLPSVKSILDQTYKNLEIIIIDDGSTDSCIDSIAGLQDHRLQILRKTNEGKSSALNLALKIIKGSFWMIQDADDISYPERVSKQVAALSNDPELAAVFVGTELIFKGRKFAAIYPRKTSEDCRKEVESFKLPAHDATGMYRTSFTKSLYFDNELKIGQGVDYVWRVGEIYPIAVLEECLYSHRVNYQSITHKNHEVNYQKINSVIEKACLRRGLNFDKFRIKCPPALLKKKRGMDSILPYAIESVVSLKRRGLYFDAIKTAFLCIWFHPFDYMFYKPFIFAFTPHGLIRFYRKKKNRI